MLRCRSASGTGICSLSTDFALEFELDVGRSRAGADSGLTCFIATADWLLHFMGTGTSSSFSSCFALDVTLVRGTTCGTECIATKWCVRWLHEAVRGWVPAGKKWWGKLMARMDQWVKDDLMRIQHKKAFEHVWELWEDHEVLALPVRPRR